jgi:hypothetical protein
MKKQILISAIVFMVIGYCGGFLLGVRAVHEEKVITLDYTLPGTPWFVHYDTRDSLLTFGSKAWHYIQVNPYEATEAIIKAKQEMGVGWNLLGPLKAYAIKYKIKSFTIPGNFKNCKNL